MRASARFWALAILGAALGCAESEPPCEDAGAAAAAAEYEILESREDDGSSHCGLDLEPS